jgi:hypothetical protein
VSQKPEMREGKLLQKQNKTKRTRRRSWHEMKGLLLSFYTKLSGQDLLSLIQSSGWELNLGSQFGEVLHEHV